MRLPKLGNVTHVALVSVLSCFLEGCAGTSPIQLATSSKSAFERAVYKGAKPWPVSAGISGNEAYRVFNQVATGLVSIQSIREDTEQRAKEICDRKGNAFESLTETTAVPPYIVRHERVMRMGYGDVGVVKLLRAAGIIVSTARGLRTALLITDNAGLHFPCTDWQIVQVIRSNPGCLSEAVTLR